MQKLILHIGRHKTGSTAIQDYLIKNGDFLQSQGYFYPDSMRIGRGHHEVSQPIASWKGQIKALLSKPKLAPPLYSEIMANNPLTPILSSEAFQNCAPTTIRKLFDQFDTTVIVYLRNHIEYLASAYAQWVHATEYKGSIEQYYLTSYSVNYWHFLKKWENNFPGKVIVRRFEKYQFHNKNLIDDFLFHALKIEMPSEKQPGTDPNPSLNSKVVQFKLYLNKTGIYQKFEKNRLYQALPLLNKEFPATKYRPPLALSKKLIKKNQRRDQKVAEKYFETEQLFEYQPQQNQDSISKQEIGEMLSHLRKLVN